MKTANRGEAHGDSLVGVCKVLEKKEWHCNSRSCCLKEVVVTIEPQSPPPSQPHRFNVCCQDSSQMNKFVACLSRLVMIKSHFESHFRRGALFFLSASTNFWKVPLILHRQIGFVYGSPLTPLLIINRHIFIVNTRVQSTKYIGVLDITYMTNGDDDDRQNPYLDYSSMTNDDEDDFSNFLTNLFALKLAQLL